MTFDFTDLFSEVRTLETKMKGKDLYNHMAFMYFQVQYKTNATETDNHQLANREAQQLFKSSNYAPELQIVALETTVEL
jgi:hypothetical protein